MREIFQYIDAHRDRFVDELCALIRQPSIRRAHRVRAADQRVEDALTVLAGAVGSRLVSHE